MQRPLPDNTQQTDNPCSSGIGTRIPEGDRPQNHALESAAIEFGTHLCVCVCTYINIHTHLDTHTHTHTQRRTKRCGRIRSEQVAPSNQRPNLSGTDQHFCCFTQPLRVTTRMTAQITPWHFLSTCFPLLFSTQSCL